MAETMKDYEAELEASFKKIEEGDILTGTVVSVDDKEIIVDLKYYAEGIIPVEDYSREPGFNVKEEVHPGDEVSATVVRKDDGNGNILLSKVEATDVLAWDKLKELKASGKRCSKRRCSCLCRRCARLYPGLQAGLELRRRHQRISEQTHPGSGNRCQ